MNPRSTESPQPANRTRLTWSQFSLYALLILTMVSAGAFRWASEPELLQKELTGTTFQTVAQVRREQSNGWWTGAVAGRMLIRGHFATDKPEGKWDGWYPGGQPYFNGQVLHGQPEGPWQVFDSNGRLQTELTLREGQPHGPARGWWPNGQLRWQGNFEDGQPRGTWLFWDISGHRTHRNVSQPPADPHPFVALSDERIAALYGHLQSDDAALRADAARALSAGGPRVAQVVAQGLADDRPPVRAVCAWVLSELGMHAHATVPSLTRALRDDDQSVARHACRALGQIGPAAAAALPELRRRLPSRQRLHARRDWLEVIVRIDPGGAELEQWLPYVINRPESWDEWLDTLTAAGDRTVPVLLRETHGSDDVKRLNAITLLGRLGACASAATTQLDQLASTDPSPDVQLAAQQAAYAIRHPLNPEMPSFSGCCFW